MNPVERQKRKELQEDMWFDKAVQDQENGLYEANDRDGQFKKSCGKRNKNKN